MLYGPHGAPDFFTPEDIDDVLRHRLGGALQLQPHRRAPDRAEAASGRARTAARPACIPSNIHDNAYAIGTRRLHRRHAGHPRAGRSEPRRLRLPGDRSSAPSCGRWASSSPATRVRFVPVSQRRRDAPGARAGARPSRRCARRLTAMPTHRVGARQPVAARITQRDGRRGVVVATAQAGDGNLLVEYGPLVLDLGAALPRARADACARRRSRLARHPRPDAGHPLAAGPLRRARLAAAQLLAASAERASRRCRDSRRDARCPRASCTCRCPGTTRPRGSRSRSTCSRCAPTRPGARATSSSSAASTAWTASTTVQRHRLRRELPGAGSGRRLPGRAGGDAARSAPPPGDHQVQPGAHLDAGERGRHRRRLPVRLRHGGPRRLPVRRPHAADVEPLPADAGFRDGKPWLLRFFDQIRFYPGERGRAAAHARGFPAGRPTGCASRRRPSDSPTTTRFLGANAAAIAAFRRTSRPPSRPSASAGSRPARRPRRSRTAPPIDETADELGAPGDCIAVQRTSRQRLAARGAGRPRRRRGRYAAGRWRP